MQIDKSSNKKMEPSKSNFDIHERIYKFVLSVIELTKNLPKNPANNVIIHQVIKSSTSMGSNDQEADATQSRKDFIAKYSIVKKENKETNYWLRIISDTNSVGISKEALILKSEGIEILKIISTIIIKAKKKD